MLIFHHGYRLPQVIIAVASIPWSPSIMRECRGVAMRWPRVDVEAENVWRY